MRPAGRAPAAPDQHHQHDSRMRFVRIRNKPAQPSAQRFVVAGSGLAQRLLVRIVALFRGSIHHRRQHAFAQIRQQRRDIQFLFHLRLEPSAFLLRPRILQIILRPAIRQRRNQRRQLQRRQPDPFAETRHARHSAVIRRRRRQRPGLLFRNVVARLLPQPQQVRVFVHPRKSQPRPHFLKINVVRVRHRFGQIHVPPVAHLHHRVARDHAFLQSRQRNHRFDRRARLEPRRKRHLLIDDRQNPAGRRIHRQHRTIRVPQRIHRDLPDQRIIVSRIIIFSRIAVRTDAALLVMMRSRRRRCGLRGRRRRSARGQRQGAGKK